MLLARSLAVLAVSYTLAACSSNGSPASTQSDDASPDLVMDAAGDAGLLPCFATGTCPHSEAGAPCTSSADCPPDLLCGFDIKGGCSAPGSCQPRPPGGAAGCAASSVAVVCGCDGVTRSGCVFSPPGQPIYDDTRSAHTGACDGSHLPQCWPECASDQTCVDHTCRPLCGLDKECNGGTKCNAATVCLPPPGCHLPDGGIADGGCSTVCYGYCE